MIKEVKNSDKLLVKVFSTETEVSTCSYAIVKLSPELIVDIKAMKKQLEVASESLNTPRLYQLNCFDSRCDFVDEGDDDGCDSDILEEFEEILTDKEVAEIGYSVASFNINLIRDEATILYVSDSGFKFSTFIKHTSTRLDTTTIPFSILETVEEEEKPKIFNIEVCRIGYSFKTLEIVAKSLAEAEGLALEKAVDYKFFEKEGSSKSFGKDVEYKLADEL